MTTNTKDFKKLAIELLEELNEYSSLLETDDDSFGRDVEAIDNLIERANKELGVNMQSQVVMLTNKEPNTVWRVQEEDIRIVIEDKFPNLNNEQKEQIIELAHQSFTIQDWTEHVETFIECYLDKVVLADRLEEE